MSNMLSRHADAIFWLARSMERIENIARVLDVNETFSRDSQEIQAWDSLLEIYGDLEFYESQHGKKKTAEDVIDFYLSDLANPNSIFSLLRQARDNARALRHLASTELWVQLNTMYNDFIVRTPGRVKEEELSRLCKFLKEGCQTHVGIAAGTMYRDEGWYIYQLSKYLERADQTTRVLDVKYHLLLPHSAKKGSAVDRGQWNALLRSVSGYQAFYRSSHEEATPSTVAAFLLKDTAFPRSVLSCLQEVEWLLGKLKSDYGLSLSKPTENKLKKLSGTLERGSVDSLIRKGLHEFLDDTQKQLILLSTEFSRNLFQQGNAAAHH